MIGSVLTGKGRVTMPDREKVIKGLECCTRYEIGKQLNNCLDCPYVEPIGFNQFRCKSQEMKEDALAMLKEQEAVEVCDRCGRRRLKSEREGR